jgi:hypothetical protein
MTESSYPRSQRGRWEQRSKGFRQRIADCIVKTGTNDRTTRIPTNESGKSTTYEPCEIDSWREQLPLFSIYDIGRPLAMIHEIDSDRRELMK